LRRGTYNGIDRCSLKIAPYAYLIIAQQLTRSKIHGIFSLSIEHEGVEMKQRKFRFKFKRHPFDDWQFFEVFATDKEAASRLAEETFRDLSARGQTVMRAFYPVTSAPEKARIAIFLAPWIFCVLAAFTVEHWKIFFFFAIMVFISLAVSHFFPKKAT
jgi:hypothetical protein